MSGKKCFVRCALFFVLGLLALSALGCSTSMDKMTLANVSGVNLAPLAREQYEVLDTVEGSGKVTYFLCLPAVSYFLNGGDNFLYVFTFGDKQFGYATESAAAVGLFGLKTRTDSVAAATYDALSKVKAADLLLPLSSRTSKTGLPGLYVTMRSTVRGKALRIKTDVDLKEVKRPATP